MASIKQILVVSMLYFCSACSEISEDHGMRSNTSVLDDTLIVAYVNNVPISNALVFVSAEQLFSEKSLNSKQKQKVIEGLIFSQAVAQKAVDQLPVDTLRDIEAKTRLYREQQLLDAFVRNKLDVERPTEQELKAYYTKNLVDFGASTEKKYEILMTSEIPRGSQRQRAMAYLDSHQQTKDWLSLIGTDEADEFKLFIRKGTSDISVLDITLASWVDSLSDGESSSVILLNGKPSVVRVVDVFHVAPKPFQEVSVQINRVLTVLKFKKALAQYKSALLANTEIEYAGDEVSQ